MQSNDFDTLALDRPHEHVLRIRFDRPDALNAINGTMHAELPEAFKALPDEDEVRVVELTGSGEAFSAGGDLDWLETLSDPDVYRQVLREGYEVIYALLDAPQPIIAAINGPAVGLGATLALHCDLTIMEESAILSDPHVSTVGVVAGDGGAVMWPHLIGHQKAKQYLFTGEKLSGTEAEDLGLVNVSAPSDTFRQTVDDWVTRLREGPPIAIQYTKRAVNRRLKQTVEELLEPSLALEGLSFQSEDHKRALRAFKQRRQAEFEGR